MNFSTPLHTHTLFHSPYLLCCCTQIPGSSGLRAFALVVPLSEILFTRCSFSHFIWSLSNIILSKKLSLTALYKMSDPPHILEPLPPLTCFILLPGFHHYLLLRKFYAIAFSLPALPPSPLIRTKLCLYTWDLAHHPAHKRPSKRFVG